ncbi:MAG: endo alpha-1,4 polygalactosaminidase [Fibrobacterota bacterium]
MANRKLHLRFPFLLLLTGLLLSGCAFFRNSHKPLRIQRWACYYGSDSTLLSQLPRYDLVVVEPDHAGVKPPADAKTLYAAYLSIGEAEKFRWYWSEVERMDGVVLYQNGNWKDDWFVDIRKAAWQDFLITRVIPKIIDQGYRGLFFDTIDSPLFLEADDPRKFSGSADAVTAFVKRVRETFPDLILISNNGLAILNRIAPYVNALTVESLNTTFRFSDKQYLRTPSELRNQRLQWLANAAETLRGKPVLVIDYMAPGQHDLADYSRTECARLGFIPFQAEIGLHSLPPEIAP